MEAQGAQIFLQHEMLDFVQDTLLITYGKGESMARGAGFGCDLEEQVSPEGGWLVPRVWERVPWREGLFILDTRESKCKHTYKIHRK